jgi:hypothetical protein
MGPPATVLIPAYGKKTLRYGTLFAPYEDAVLDGGIVSVEAEEAALVCKGREKSCIFKADPGFKVLKEIQQGYPGA